MGLHGCCHGRQLILQYELSSSGSEIYFPGNSTYDDSNWKLRPPIKIEELTENKLVVSENFMGDSSTVSYIKK